jgi:hypothetical protein
MRPSVAGEVITESDPQADWGAFDVEQYALLLATYEASA